MSATIGLIDGTIGRDRPLTNFSRPWVFATILAVLLASPAPVYSQTPSADINAALAARQRAGDDAAERAADAALISAVVGAIAANPGAARAIVAAAVAAAPDRREAIVSRASAAYPGFAGQFATPPQPAPRVEPAAVAERRDPSLLDPGYLVSIPLNAARILASPWRFDKSDWINTAVVLGVGGGLIALDKPIRNFIQGDLRGGATDDAADFLREFGDTYLLAMGLGAAYVGAELIGDEPLQETALLAEESLLLASVLGLGIKWVSQRDRPDSGKSSTSWSPFSFDDSNTSFPSGHAINAFSVASVIASQYEDYPWAAPIAYTLATGTALSRLNQDKHWASDAFVGAAVGYFVGKMVVRYNPFNPAQGVTLRPWGGADARGLSLAIEY